METIALWENVPGLCEEAPVLEYYPAKDRKSDATVVICPGGGYYNRAQHEGRGYAEFLNSIGMDAFVVEYRCRQHKFPLPLLDARRAVRYVRANADKYGLRADRIAIMGSSAGGHLAAMASTYFAPIEGEGADALDETDCKPNATILCYPVINIADLGITHTGSVANLLGEHLELAQRLDPSRNVNADTPTAFIWHTSNDGGVNVINSYRYAEALRRANKVCEMHIFPDGPHGLGLAPNNPHVAQWAGLMRNLLINLGWFA